MAERSARNEGELDVGAVTETRRADPTTTPGCISWAGETYRRGTAPEPRPRECRAVQPHHQDRRSERARLRASPGILAPVRPHNILVSVSVGLGQVA